MFRKEIESLKKPTTDVKRETSPLHKLDPFLDDEGTLRVGGRWKQASLLYGVKHPIILPQKSHMTTLVVQHFHEKAKHQGKGITMNEIRSNGFWEVCCSKAVCSHIIHCPLKLGMPVVTRSDTDKKPAISTDPNESTNMAAKEKEKEPTLQDVINSINGLEKTKLKRK